MNTIFETLVESYVSAFIKSVCTEFHSIESENDRVEFVTESVLMQKWRQTLSAPAEVTVNSVPLVKLNKKATKNVQEVDVRLCPYKFTKGVKVGQICSVKVKRDGLCCSSHKRYDAIMDAVDQQPEVVIVSEKLCPMLLKSGPKKGLACGAKSLKGNTHCARHKKNGAVIHDLSDESKFKKVRSKYVHIASGIIVNKRLEAVYIETDGERFDMDDDDIVLAKAIGFTIKPPRKTAIYNMPEDFKHDDDIHCEIVAGLKKMFKDSIVDETTRDFYVVTVVSDDDESFPDEVKIGDYVLTIESEDDN